MIVRVKRRSDPFVVLSRATLREARLSLKARGLWALCMSFPDDWEFRPSHLVTLSERDGDAAVRSGLEELRAVGLVRYEQARGDDGTMGPGEWTVYETAELCAEERAEGTAEGTAMDGDLPDADKPDAGNRDPAKRADSPDRGQPDAAQPDADNRRLRSNELTEHRTHGVTKQQQQRARGSTRGARRDAGDVVALSERGVVEDEGPVVALVRRGIEEDAAGALVLGHGVDRVAAAIALYDERRASDNPPDGVGFLVAAIRKGWQPKGSASGSAPRATRYLRHQALAWLRERGLPEGAMGEHFEPAGASPERLPVWTLRGDGSSKPGHLKEGRR